MKQTILITGGSRGIGAACVRAFTAQGWQVAFCYQKSEEQARALAQSSGAFAFCCDVSKRQEIEAFVAAARAQFGSIDAVVCNAGIAQQKMFCDLTDDDWDRMFDVNLKSAFYTIQAVLPDFVHRKAGSIVTVSSMWGESGASCESHYAASKAALIGLSKSLAQELGLSGIRVNCITPGVIDTEMNAMHDVQTMAELAQETALRRIGTPEDVAQAALFLCSEKALYITGQTLQVSGGFGF